MISRGILICEYIVWILNDENVTVGLGSINVIAINIRAVTGITIGNVLSGLEMNWFGVNAIKYANITSIPPT